MNGGGIRGAVSEIKGRGCIAHRALWATVRTLVLIIRTFLKSVFPFHYFSAMSNVSLEVRGGHGWL